MCLSKVKDLLNSNDLKDLSEIVSDSVLDVVWLGSSSNWDVLFVFFGEFDFCVSFGGTDLVIVELPPAISASVDVGEETV